MSSGNLRAMSGQGGDPRDLMTQMEIEAALVAERFNAYVKAGIPPMTVAVMLGTMLGTMGTQSREGDDGK